MKSGPLETVTKLAIVQAGFPSPADDYREEEIDLKSYLQPNPTATYLARVKGDSMVNAHIPDNAIVVIDKSIRPKNNSVIVATVNGENVIKHLVRTHSGSYLVSNNSAYKPIPITDDMQFAVWGVVTHVIVKLNEP